MYLLPTSRCSLPVSLLAHAFSLAYYGEKLQATIQRRLIRKVLFYNHCYRNSP